MTVVPWSSSWTANRHSLRQAPNSSCNHIFLFYSSEHTSSFKHTVVLNRPTNSFKLSLSFNSLIRCFVEAIKWASDLIVEQLHLHLEMRTSKSLSFHRRSFYALSKRMRTGSHWSNPTVFVLIPLNWLTLVFSPIKAASSTTDLNSIIAICLRLPNAQFQPLHCSHPRTLPTPPNTTLS